MANIDVSAKAAAVTRNVVPERSITAGVLIGYQCVWGSGPKKPIYKPQFDKFMKEYHFWAKHLEFVEGKPYIKSKLKDLELFAKTHITTIVKMLWEEHGFSDAVREYFFFKSLELDVEKPIYHGGLVPMMKNQGHTFNEPTQAEIMKIPQQLLALPGYVSPFGASSLRTGEGHLPTQGAVTHSLLGAHLRRVSDAPVASTSQTAPQGGHTEATPPSPQLEFALKNRKRPQEEVAGPSRVPPLKIARPTLVIAPEPMAPPSDINEEEPLDLSHLSTRERTE